MTFKEIIKRITQKISSATASEINIELNNFIQESGINLRKMEKSFFNTSGSYTVLGAKIASITISSAGTGYTAGTVALTGGAGTEAVGRYTVNGSGEVTAIIFSYYGNYTTKPTGITLSDPGAGGSGFSGTIVWDDVVVVTSNNHELSNGDTVNLVNTSGDDLDGSYEIANKTDNTFDITADWAATGVGTWTAMEETNELDFPNNVVSIKEVYLNSKKLNIQRTRRNIVEGNITANSDGCFISEDRKIIFPGNLESTDLLYCIAYVIPDENNSLTANTEIDLARVYFLPIVYYVLKELYSNSKYFNETMAIKYEGLYRKAIYNARASQQVQDTVAKIGSYDFGYSQDTAGS